MKHRKTHSSPTLPLAALACWLGLAISPAVFGGGVVTELTQANLVAAMAGGGTVTFATNGTLTLTSTVFVANNTVLDGSGAAVKLSGGDAVRLFHVGTNAQFWIKGLTLTDGRVIGANGASGDPPQPGQDAGGACVFNQGGTLTLTDCVLTNHFVRGGTAGSALVSAANNIGVGGRAMGGAVCVLGGHLNVTNCQVGWSQAVGGQGSPVTPGGSVVGPAGAGNGGAVYIAGGGGSFQGVVLVGNTASGGSPQVYNSNGGVGGDGAGGGLYTTGSLVTFVSSVLATNVAMGGGPTGYVYLGPGGGRGLGGAIYVAAGATGLISSVSFLSNTAVGAATAYRDTPGPGLGGAAYSEGSLFISASSVSGNQAVGRVGGYGSQVGRGGGICSTGTLVVDRTTLDHNLAMGGNAQGLYPYNDYSTNGEGGAIWSSGSLLATNSTIVTNQAVGGGCGPVGAVHGGDGLGGGLFVTGGSGVLVNLTIAGNRADGGTNSTSTFELGRSLGGGLGATNAVLMLQNSIVAGSANGGDIWGNLIDRGYNLCSDASAHFTAVGSVTNTNPELLPLTNNGGPSATMSLYVGSPARDVIPSGFPGVDQRGEARPQGAAGDMGAVEATDTAILPPAILAQPVPVVVPPGGSTNFSVSVMGSNPSYQWWHNSAGLPAGTSAALAVNSAHAGDQGNYLVVVSNSAGVVTSAVATLTFDASALKIVTPPSDQTVLDGTPATFSVLASGIPPVAYQWQHGSALIGGATASTYTVQPAHAGDAGNYSVIVSNGYKVLTSAPALLTVTSAVPVIVTQPISVVIAPGGSTNFIATASGPSLGYRWWHSGAPIPEGSNSVLVITSAQAGAQGGYFVVVTNYTGAVTSTVAVLTFDATALNLLSQPKSQTVAVGFPATFDVLATGIPTITFQWQRDGIPILGATDSSYTLSSPGTNDSGSYSVVVSNDWKGLVSAPAQLLVTAVAMPPVLALQRSGGQLTIGFTAEGGRGYRLLSSSDLASWSAVATNAAAGFGPEQFVVPMRGAGAFYRVVTP